MAVATEQHAEHWCNLFRLVTCCGSSSAVTLSNQFDSGGRDLGFERRADFFLWRTLGAASTFFVWRRVRDFVEAFVSDSGLRGFRL